MTFKKFIYCHDNKKFIIEEDLPEVGAYFYVYNDKNCIYDCLQDNIEICKKVAFDEYNIPYENWKIIES